MKTLFISISAAVASLLGFHSHAIQSSASIPIARTQTAMNQSASTSPAAARQTTARGIQVTSPAITFPSDTDILHPGQKYNITWQDVPSNTVSYSVNLEVASLGNYYVVMSLGTVSPEQRSLAFTVPNAIPPRTNYQVSFSKGTQIADVVFRSKGFTIK